MKKCVFFIINGNRLLFVSVTVNFFFLNSSYLNDNRIGQIDKSPAPGFDWRAVLLLREL